MHAEKQDWAGLTSVVVHDLPPGKQPRLVALFCHGYGAPGTDLVGLAQGLIAQDRSLAESVAFIFPAAILSLEEIGIPGGRAWWMVDLERLIYRPDPQFIRQFREGCPEGMPEARAKLTQLIQEASSHFDVPPERFVLGGFSQGAMLAVDVALRMAEGPAAVCILSGGLTNEGQWRKLAPQRGPLTVLQSHGRYDAILPLPMAAALRDLLLEAGADVDFVLFDGGHEIPPVVMRRMAALLKRLAQAE